MINQPFLGFPTLRNPHVCLHPQGSKLSIRHLLGSGLFSWLVFAVTTSYRCKKMGLFLGFLIAKARHTSQVVGFRFKQATCGHYLQMISECTAVHRGSSLQPHHAPSLQAQYLALLGVSSILQQLVTNYRQSSSGSWCCMSSHRSIPLIPTLTLVDTHDVLRILNHHANPRLEYHGRS